MTWTTGTGDPGGVGGGEALTFKSLSNKVPSTSAPYSGGCRQTFFQNLLSKSAWRSSSSSAAGGWHSGAVAAGMNSYRSDICFSSTRIVRYTPHLPDACCLMGRGINASNRVE